MSPVPKKGRNALRSPTICTDAGEFIIDRVPTVEILRLRGYDPDGYVLILANSEPAPQYIVPHRKRPLLYIALVAPAIILAELRRELSKRIDSTAANQTVTEVHFSNDKGAGVYYEPNQRVCSTYAAAIERLKGRAA